MAKRQIELEELRKLSDDEIKESVVELKGELVVLRMKQAARQEIKSSEFQRMRKRVRILLILILLFHFCSFGMFPSSVVKGSFTMFVGKYCLEEASFSSIL